MDFVDYKCLESLIIEGESMTATEGVKEFFGKFFNKKNQPNNSNSNVSRMLNANYTSFSNELRDAYPNEWTKELNLRKKYLRSVISTLNKFKKKYSNLDIQFAPYVINIQTALSSNDNQSKSFNFLNTPLPSNWLRVDVDDGYGWPYDFQFPIAKCNAYDDNIPIMEIMNAFEDSPVVGTVELDANESGLVVINILPTDEMCKLAYEFAKDEQTKNDIKNLIELKEQCKRYK